MAPPAGEWAHVSSGLCPARPPWAKARPADALPLRAWVQGGAPVTLGESAIRVSDVAMPGPSPMTNLPLETLPGPWHTHLSTKIRWRIFCIIVGSLPRNIKCLEATVDVI